MIKDGFVRSSGESMKNWVFLTFSLLVTSCVSPPPEDSWVEETCSSRTGYPLVKDSSSEEFEERISTLLSCDLTVDTAIEIALLNNFSLQAELEEVGIARADLWQACLISNPIFSGMIRFPHPTGALNSETDLCMPLIDLMLRPLRKKSACYNLAAIKAETASKVLTFIADVKEAFYKVRASSLLFETEKQRAELCQLAFDVAYQQKLVGNIGSIDLIKARDKKDDAKTALLKMEQEFIPDRQELASLMGFSDLNGIKISQNESSHEPLPPLEEIEELAQKMRLDLWALYQEMLSIAQDGAMKAWWTYTEVAGGVSFENEYDNVWELGPSIELTIPLFDYGQAARQRLLVQFNQMKKLYLAKQIEIAGSVRKAYYEAKGWQNVIEELTEGGTKRHETITEETLKLYNVMNASIFDLLEAERQELDNDSDIAEAEREYQIARARLEEAVGTAI